MNKPALSPRDELRIDNLVTSHALLVAEIQQEKIIRRQVLATLERIERALAIPMVYTLTQACRRIGISVSTAYADPNRLPKSVKGKPKRYLVEDVEALAAERIECPPRRYEHRKRPA